ncbi:MAG: heme ABC transporter ATP-binding protein CcmA [Betaproteobacteria bacterium RIFCSPLOWO2_12_FULL_66_14]|nr:MAG: heme ABC transporter ATP-binding protein CcmA [Betaproteobacteria bacterium RIFCSPLOWO2_12_FULL_66_14]
MLEAAELECERGGWVLFRGLSFALQAGESLRIAGANGSGKTSLLRILCGLLPPAGGEVRWRGAAIRGLREDYSRELVYLGHAPAVKDDLSAAENLEISCALAGMPADAGAIAEALARFGLAGKGQPSRRLSQGQRRRAALARLALSASRPLWLLDEPFSALDVAGVALLRALIEAHLARGGAVIFTTHQDAGIGAARVIDLDPSS